MRKAVVINAFPFAFDGINIQFLTKGSTFPPDGQPAVADSSLDGLVKAGYLEEIDGVVMVPEEDAAMNRAIIVSIDKRLTDASDEELMSIVARSGAPFSGNLIRAELVLAAKRQVVAEAQGASPVLGMKDASDADTSQAPVSEKVETQSGGDGVKESGTGETGPTKVDTDLDLDGLKKDELEEIAKDKGIDISDAKTKADIVALIKAAD